MKIWWSVPLVILLAWQLLSGRRRNLGRIAIGAATALALGRIVNATVQNAVTVTIVAVFLVILALAWRVRTAHPERRPGPGAAGWSRPSWPYQSWQCPSWPWSSPRRSSAASWSTGPIDTCRTSHPRRDNRKWQHDLLAYLRSGNAVILLRKPDTVVSPATLAGLRSGGLIARVGNKVVYRVAHPDTR